MTGVSAKTIYWPSRESRVVIMLIAKSPNKNDSRRKRKNRARISRARAEFPTENKCRVRRRVRPAFNSASDVIDRVKSTDPGPWKRRGRYRFSELGSRLTFGTNVIRAARDNPRSLSRNVGQGLRFKSITEDGVLD